MKKLLFYLIMIAMTWLGIELVAFAGYSVHFRELFSPSSVAERMAAYSESALVLEGNIDRWGNKGNDVEVLHPFFGYVNDPQRSAHGHVSDFGFSTREGVDPFVVRSTGRVIIAVFGGSFAAGVYWHAAKLLRDLGKDLGKEIVVLNFSRGGGKQPEQLAIFAYLLSLGAEFDIVLNIDGFNEVALPSAENLSNGVFPFYPRDWSNRVRNLIDPAALRHIGHVESLKEQRNAWAHLFHRHDLYRSPMLSFLWRIRDSWIEQTIYEARTAFGQRQAQSERFVITRQALDCMRIKRLPQPLVRSIHALQLFGRVFDDWDALSTVLHPLFDEQSFEAHQGILRDCSALRSGGYVMTGPPYHYETEVQLYDDLTMVWQRSSIQMSALAEANGARYFHFLQPNQYLRGSKPMAPEETRIAITENHPYRGGAEEGYPLLRERGRKLLEQGIDFMDLTMIFANNDDVLYVDDCCHLNKRGYALIMEQIVAAIWPYH